MRIKSKREFERLIRRYDGEDGGAAPTNPAPTDVPPANPNPAPTEPAQPFKSFASEADYQKDIDFKIQQALKTHEDKLKGKLTPEIRKQLEAEANMTAEQKYQAQLDALEADKKALAKEKSRIKAESIFSAKGISEEDSAAMLDSIVSDDAEETEKRANALVAAIEKATNEKIKAAMKDVKAPNSTTTAPSADGPDIAFAKGRAERRSAASKTANDTLNYYLGGNKK